MINIIEVNGIRVYSNHGCLNEEAIIGTNYVCDVVLHTNFVDSAIEDDLDKTINYVDVRAIAEEEILKRAKLIETVVKRIVNRIKNELKGVEKVRVKLTKVSPPINGNVDNVAVIWEE